MNNRQNGRRRGRGGQQVRNGQPGNQDRGNRIDNRARGNAAQLLEKYKTLASEAQRQGDRVNTEYYLQFADHYFRVLSESRARFEEQRPPEQQRNARDFRDDFGQDEDGEGEGQRYDPSEANWGEQGDESQPQPQQARQNDRRGDNRNDDRRGNEDRRPDRQQDGRQQEARQCEPRQQDNRQRDERPRYEERAVEASEGEEQPRAETERRPRRQRTPRAAAANGEGHLQEELADKPFSERIEVDRLPQSLSQPVVAAPAPVANDADPVAAEEGEAEAPRRRRAPRRPRGEAVVEA